MYVGKARTLEEWADLYEKKTGDKFNPKSGKLFYFSNKGFATFVIDKDMIIVRQVCGDGNFWRYIAEVLAIEHGFHKLGVIFLRPNVKAYFRSLGIEITNETVSAENGRIKYFLKQKNTGQIGQATPVTTLKGENRYLVTWEVE